jgi:hypothetical protein
MPEVADAIRRLGEYRFVIHADNEKILIIKIFSFLRGVIGNRYAMNDLPHQALSRAPFLSATAVFASEL